MCYHTIHTAGKPHHLSRDDLIVFLDRPWCRLLPQAVVEEEIQHRVDAWLLDIPSRQVKFDNRPPRMNAQIHRFVSFFVSLLSIRNLQRPCVLP